MRKTISRIMCFAVITALVCIGCGGDDGGQNKNLEIGNILNVITGRGADVSAHNTYTLTVNVSPTGSGTVLRSKNADSYEPGAQITLTAKPNNGYEFVGWTGMLNSTEPSVIVTMDGDKILSAEFRRIGANLPQYSVYFNANGATGGTPPETIQRDSGSVISLPGQAGMVRDKYSFAGWNTEGDGSGESYNVYGKYTVTRNVALFAQWTRNPYTLTVNVSPPNSGTVSRSPNKETYLHGEQVTVTAAPTSGNVFNGWSGASSSKNNAITIIMDDDKTLTAGFGTPNAKQFSVYFNSNGATDGANPPQTAIADSGNSITLPGQQTMVKAGYSFSGWNTNRNGTGTKYNVGDPYRVVGESTLFAKWIPIYTVTFNGNGTNVGVPGAAVDVDSGTTITLSAMTRSGYKFDGWNTNSSGTGTNYATNFSYVVTGNVTLYARWVPVYTVTFNINNATSGTTPMAVTVDSGSAAITLPSQGTLTRTGYNFSGWNTKSDGTGTDYNAGASYSVKSDVTLYAKWNIKTYTLTTNVTPLGGGTVSRSPSANSYDHGSSVTVTATPASGYMFAGWSSDLTSNATSVVITMDGNKILTAMFHRTVKIGNQTWMAENLNYQPLTGNSWCYMNSTDSCNKYGRLYDWNTAKTVCPIGWHLPTRKEWDNLSDLAGTGQKSVNFINGSDTMYYWPGAGKKLKSTSGWYNNGNGTDDFKFSALPGGYRYSDGSFSNAGNGGYWWTATERGSYAYYRYMPYYYDVVFEGHSDKGYSDKGDGFSVRCLQDN